MSEPLRYLAKCPWYSIELQAHPKGEFVLYSDYARLKAEVDDLKSEVTYQKQKAQETVEFICECIAKGEFKAFKNGCVKFGKTTKGVQS